MLTTRINRVGSEAEMRVLASEVARAVTGGTALFLFGELGAGKTTFVQALAQELGVVERVTSPTFTIAGEYEVKSHISIKVLAHIDLYRLKAGQAGQEPLVTELLQQAAQPDRLTIIEWADRLGPVELPRVWRLTFSHGSHPGERIVDVVRA